MPFRIRFLPATEPGAMSVTTDRLGDILLGEECEEFVSQIGYWRPQDYEKQWREGLMRAAIARLQSCLITSIHDPAVADVATWWLLYPKGDTIQVQNALLRLDLHRAEFSIANPYSCIPSHRSVTDDGYSISEWSIGIDDIRAAIDARTGS